MMARKVGPALAAGCMLVKAPAEAHLTALAMADLRHRGGILTGFVNIITALEHTVAVGQGLTTDPVIKVSFMGSTGVDKLLMDQYSSTLKMLSFEPGGNATFSVLKTPILMRQFGALSLRSIESQARHAWAPIAL
ncbi:putative Succinate-semialdehyde dehydrogenase [Seiridium cardinale]